jgi:hypothetical protein
VSGHYRPGSYESFFIHEPKRRLISAAPFRDRVVHHALCNVVEPMFDRGFIHDTYANRRGKGTHRAVTRAQAFARRHRYVLLCDVQQFFPSLDHAVLRGALFRRIADERVRGIVDVILASGQDIHSETTDALLFPGDDLLAVLRPRGLPIGNLTSQFWANVYMDAFDHFVKRELRCPAYIRYVDDLLLFADKKDRLWEWHHLIIRRLERMRLRLHPAAHPRPVGEGIPFLGFVVFPDRRQVRPRKGYYFRRRLALLLDEQRTGVRSARDVGVRVRSWVNHVRYANSTGLRKAVFRDATLMSQRRRALPPSIASAESSGGGRL